MIDNKIIKKFRSYVNKNNNFIIAYFKDREKKNHWNCICSCMDWIDVAVAQISYLQQKTSSEDINICSMEIYSLISAIDVINESVTQLSRVITGVMNPPFKGINKIFLKSIEFKDDSDEDYFKQIRAVFGAHPINLNKNKEKWFASWPTKGIWDESDFACRLYPADVEKNNITFGLELDELNEFLISRYNHLNKLIKNLEKMKDRAVEKNINRIIKDSDDPLEQLYILKEEAVLRFDNEYYSYTLDILIRFFEIDRSFLKNEELLDEYFKGLTLVIKELKKNMQNMDSEELVNNVILEPNIPQKLRYAYSKISDSFYGDSIHSLYGVLIKEMKEYLKDTIDFPSKTSIDEDYLLIKTGFYITK